MPRLSVAFVFLLGASVLGAAQPQPALPTKDDPERFGLIEIDPVRVKYVSTDAWIEDERVGGQAKKRVAFHVRDPQSQTTSAGVLKNKKLNPDRVAETVDAVAAAYHKELVGALKVTPGQIWVVASCHFSDLPEDQQADLRDKILKAIRRTVPAGWERAEWDKAPVPFKILTPKEEFTYVCYGMKDRGESLGDCVVTHVGLGPTHACYFEDNGGRINFRGIGYLKPVPGGMGFTENLQAKMVEGNVVPKGADIRTKFPDSLKRELPDLAAQMADSARGVNGLYGRKTHFVTGDLAEALLALVKPEAILDTSDRVELSSKEIDALVDTILDAKNRKADGAFDHPPARYPAKYGDAVPTEVKEKIDRFYNDVIRDSMSPEELASAAVILRTLSKQLQYDDKTKTVIILKDTRHAWSTGYLRQMVDQNLGKLIRQQK